MPFIEAEKSQIPRGGTNLGFDHWIFFGHWSLLIEHSAWRRMSRVSRVCHGSCHGLMIKNGPILLICHGCHGCHGSARWTWSMERRGSPPKSEVPPQLVSAMPRYTWLNQGRSSNQRIRSHIHLRKFFGQSPIFHNFCLYCISGEKG
jgi:hypothetical protein